MSGRCQRNCDLDCHPRYQGAVHPLAILHGLWDERASRRRASISAGLRKRGATK